MPRLLYHSMLQPFLCAKIFLKTNLLNFVSSPSPKVLHVARSTSGAGEDDDNNTGEVEGRDFEEVLSVACSTG